VIVKLVAVKDTLNVKLRNDGVMFVRAPIFMPHETILAIAPAGIANWVQKLAPAEDGTTMDANVETSAITCGAFGACHHVLVEGTAEEVAAEIHRQVNAPNEVAKPPRADSPRADSPAPFWHKVGL